MSTANSETAILDGIRIVEMCTGIPGPVGALLLAEAGADVVKVEPPGGDAMRASPGFKTWNRSKRSVVLDLGNAGDRKSLDELLAGADVLMHGMRPGVASRHRLDDATLARQFPQLVVCSVLGYPVGHADADRPGHDILVQARMGLMDEQLGSREGPTFMRLPIPSWGAAYLSAIGVLARLRARDRDGCGGVAHTSLLQGALAPMMQYWARAENPSPRFAFGLPKNMSSGLYECADGSWIHMMGRFEAVIQIPEAAAVIEALTEDELARAGEKIARFVAPPALVSDPRILVAAFLKRSASEWLPLLWANDIAVQPANPPGEVLRDEQAAANGYVIRVDDPELGRLTQAGTPFSVTPPSRVSRPAPRLDENGKEVLAERRPAPTAASGSTGRPGAGPLDGVRVLDFGNFLAGPFSPMLMSDLGAEVIKLEATTGDMMRHVARSFCGCQRGKRSIGLDLKNPDVRPVVEELVRRADIVHHNLRYPAAKKLRIDYDSLAALHPTLIYCHTSSYGRRGERADWPGYDQLFQACSGWEVASGGPGNPPLWHRMGMMDHQNAMASTVATLLALRERDRTGRGQFLSSSILGACVLTMSELYLDANGELASFPGVDSRQTGIGPGYRIYEVRDGWIAVAALGKTHLEALQGVAGATSPDALESALAERESSELLVALDAAGVPAEPVRTGQEQGFFDNAEHREARMSVAYPHAEMGVMEQVGALWNFADLPQPLDQAPPTLGQHTREILSELGTAPSQIDAWVDSGAVAIDTRHTPW